MNRTSGIKYRNKISFRKKNILKIFYLSIFVLVLITLFVFIVLSINIKNTTFLIVSKTDIYVYHFTDDKVYLLNVPGDALVDVTQGRGRFKLSKVYEISDVTGGGGELVRSTIVANIGIPVDYWSYAENFTKQSKTSKFMKLIVGGYQGNVGLMQRLLLGVKLLLFAGSAETISLKDTSFLIKSEFYDKSLIYEISGSLPEKIANIFFDDIFSSDDIKIVVKTENNDNFQIARGVIERLGAKPIREIKSDDISGCVVEGNNMHIVQRLSKTFNCSSAMDENSQYSAVVIMGENYIF